MGGEFLYVIPYWAAFVALTTVAGTFAIWLVWATWRRGSKQAAPTPFPTRAVAAGLLCLTMPAGCVFACQPVTQPESIRTVAAFEVPLATAADRVELINLLQREAATDGLTVDGQNDAELQQSLRALPDSPLEQAATVGRHGKNPETFADLMLFRDGGYWLIAFYRSEETTLAQRFRDRVMQRVLERWPTTMAFPLSPSGSIPFKRDLIATERGYVMADSAARARYGCPGDAPAKTGASTVC